MRFLVPLVLASLASADPAPLAELVERLGDEDPAVRDEAQAEIEQSDPDCCPAIEHARRNAEDPEVRARLAAALTKLRGPRLKRDLTTALEAARAARKPLLLICTSREDDLDLTCWSEPGLIKDLNAAFVSVLIRLDSTPEGATPPPARFYFCEPLGFIRYSFVGTPSPDQFRRELAIAKECLSGSEPQARERLGLLREEVFAKLQEARGACERGGLAQSDVEPIVQRLFSVQDAQCLLGRKLVTCLTQDAGKGTLHPLLQNR